MKAILVDDEVLALGYLEKLLIQIDSTVEIRKFVDPLLAKEEILKNVVDVVFLDINLPEMNGIELAEQLIEGKPDLPIIFITAYRDYAIKAFEINALDYLVKPFTMERLSTTLNRIQKQIDPNNELNIQQNGKLYLTLFNQVSLKRDDGTEIELIWRTKKTEELFLYLLSHNGKFVRKSFLVEILWPDNETEKVYSYLYTAIYHIRKVIKEYSDFLQLKNTADGYTLLLNNVELDTVKFEKKMNNIPAICKKTEALYELALTIYTGEYLQEYDYWWAEAEREKLKKWWIWASYQLANWYYNEKKIEKALKIFLLISERLPEEEDASLKVMQIYEATENFLLVEQQYDQLKSFLETELNIEPSSHIEEWFNRFQKRKEAIKNI
ncbi:DNA-binding response regulator [Heyndrickxia sporothermodurans]|nr:DNA-binding response regulator [Heyndrickxia sporothermodurans]